jgi:RNA polymerase sigma factor (sigma-70 family)
LNTAGLAEGKRAQSIDLFLFGIRSRRRLLFWRQQMSVVERAGMAWIDEDEDRRLLRQFVEQRSSAAFAQLRERHARMVYRTCYRELGDEETAKDAAQAVFIALAERAHRLSSKVVIAGWLFKASLLASRSIRRSEKRRQRRERIAALPHAQLTWDSVEPAVNQALDRLPAADRDLLVLRYLDERTLREAGQALGISEDAARMRLTRALERLRKQLGIVATATALGTVLDQSAKAAILVPTLTPSATRLGRQVARQMAMGTGLSMLIAIASGGAVVGAGYLGYRIIAPTLGEGKIVREARAGLAASDKKLTSYQAEIVVSFRDVNGGSNRMRALYWRKGSNWRLTENPGSSRVVDGEGSPKQVRIIATLDSPAGPNEGRASVAGPDRRVSELDPWEWSLFRLPSRVYTKPPLKTFSPSTALDKGKLAGAKWTTEGGHRLAYLSLGVDGGRSYEIWLDPAHDWRASRVICKTDRRSMVFRDEYAVKAWVGNLPQKIERTSWFNGKKTESAVATITVKADANFKLPPMPKAPKGSLLMDEVKSMVFPIDENWRIIGPGKPVSDGSLTTPPPVR